MFPRNENRNEGTFACSPGTKTGTRAHSPKPPFYENALLFRKILVSVKFVSAILGPEIGAPILWTPGKNAFFLQEKPVSTKFLVLGGGILGLGGGRGKCRFYFYGRGDFSDLSPSEKGQESPTTVWKPGLQNHGHLVRQESTSLLRVERS